MMNSKQHDFRVQDEGTIKIFWPTSQNAISWCESHLPDDCPRWGKNGYVIEHRYIDDIVAGATADGLGQTHGGCMT
jgi:hypothetical protein